MRTDSENLGFIRRLPKTETHLHIEGALPFSLLQEMDPEQFVVPPASWAPDFKFRSFEQFEDELLAMALQWFTSPERYHRAAQAVFEGLIEENVKYVETSFHAGIIEHLGVAGPEILHAIKEAIPDDLEVRVFMGMLRDQYSETMGPILDDCVKWEGLAGIDLHGVEVLPIEPWAERLWAAARDAGLTVKAHAGEFGGADYVRDAIEKLKVRRIQHGVRAIEDPDVVQLAKDVDATFDTCPISNVKLAVVETMEEHAIRPLFDAGVRCTISTDDPLSFGNQLNDEYEALASTSFSQGELARLARNGFEVALLTEEEKAPYLRELDTIIGQAEGELA